MFRFPDTKNILLITTNWDLGIFNNFNNVVQLHGRCDYAEQAILPLQNISLLMPQVKEDFEKLNCGILPGIFLERCLKTTNNFIFWGTALNEYDTALWHFIRGFLKANSNVQLGIGTQNDEESYRTAKERVMRFFPTLTINNYLCQIFPSK